MSDGVSSNDFSQILSDMGRSIQYKVVTKTVDSITGSEISVYGSASTQTLIFFREENRYLWDKEGLLQVGDAYIIAPTSLGIKRYDEFTIESNTFYIENTTRRVVLTTTMMDFATCFLVT